MSRGNGCRKIDFAFHEDDPTHALVCRPNTVGDAGAPRVTPGAQPEEQEPGPHNRRPRFASATDPAGTVTGSHIDRVFLPQALRSCHDSHRNRPRSPGDRAVAEMYDVDREAFADLPNFTQVFSARPEVYAAWRQLNGAIKANMEPRRYELATIAAARRLRSSYCRLAHGAVLMARFFQPEAVRALVDDYRTADLEPADVAVMDLADKSRRTPRQSRKSISTSCEPSDSPTARFSTSYSLQRRDASLARHSTH